MATQQQYAETEERIFEAALQVFARKGKDGARMQEIADAAAINKAMLHYYFRSKDQLYEAVFDYVFRRFIHSFGEAMSDTDGYPAFLHAFIDGYIDFVRENLAVMKLIMNEQLAGAPVLGQRLRQLMESSEAAPPRLFIERTQAAVEAGEIRPVDPYQMLLTTLSGCIFSFLFYPALRFVAPAAQDRDAFIEARKAHLFDVLYQGLRWPPASRQA